MACVNARLELLYCTALHDHSLLLLLPGPERSLLMLPAQASLFEGGIRVPGILEWPEMIRTNRQTHFPAITSDYLPTFLDAIGLAHPQPTWAMDGISLMPLIQQAAAMTPSDPSFVMANRSKPLGFKLGQQEAWIDNDWKVVANPHKGQCKTMYPPYSGGKVEGTFLFNLAADPTESNDLSKDPAHAARFAAMTTAMANWDATIFVSQVHESQCEQSGHKPPTPVPPSPPGPPRAGFELKHDTKCIALAGSPSTHDKFKATLGDCGGSPQWSKSDDGGFVMSLDPRVVGSSALKLNAMGGQKKCALGNSLWTGKLQSSNAFTLQALGPEGQVLLASSGCKGLYAGACADGVGLCLGARSEALTFDQSTR